MSTHTVSRSFPGLASRVLEVRSLPGLTPYAEARALQLELIERRARDEIPDTLLFLEHAPVITRGKGLQRKAGEEGPLRAMPFDPRGLPPGMDFSESERGGDLTYHGPGQLVIYPIWKITDIAAFLRGWERVLVDWLHELGLQEAGQVSDATGIWVGKKKVGSIGIAVRRWVTYHGIAINLVNDLAPFRLISPCGFPSETMARLADLLPSTPELTDGLSGGGAWRAWAERGILARLTGRF